MVRRVDDGEDVPEETVQKLLYFFEVFGERYHLGKEERVFIPSVENSCDSRFQCGIESAVGETYHEHEAAHALLRYMRASAQRLGEESARRTFVRHAIEYMALMRGQMAKEKDTLIRTASFTLASKDNRLLRSFSRYLEGEAIPETSEQFASDIDSILSDLSVVVPRARRRAYSRGTIPYHRGTNDKIRF